MPKRILKKTRARGLPPKVLLSAHNDASGSYPTIWRTSSDNRTGKYPVCFNDSRTLVFNSTSNGAMYNLTPAVAYPLMMDSTAMSGGLTTEALYELYGTSSNPIVTSGPVLQGLSDVFVSPSSAGGQLLEPWKDHVNPEMAAKPSSSLFYASGSSVATVGPGFEQPLWSKNKIIIDITPTTEHTINLRYWSATEPSYPMAYWSPVSGLWEGLGSGKNLNTYQNIEPLLFFDDQYIAFSPSADNAAVSQPIDYLLRGRPVANFGFPFHPKFQPTSSQQVLMSNYISEPFLLEKIVFEFSGSLQSDLFSGPAMWTFFVVNSRPTISGSSSPPRPSYTITGSTTTPYVTSSVLTSAYLDLVDYMQVVFTYNAETNTAVSERELFVSPSNPGGSGTAFTYSHQVTISSSVKSPVSYMGVLARLTGSGANSVFYKTYLSQSNRNQLYDVNGRDWVGTFLNPVLSQSITLTGDGEVTNVPTNFSKINPYILFPTDKLTFGVQNPLNVVTTADEYSSSISFFPTGINKIILYGSNLRINEETNQLVEYHEDTLNQLLCSTTIHEVVG